MNHRFASPWTLAIACAAGAWLLSVAAHATVVDFEDHPLSPESCWRGPDTAGYQEMDSWQELVDVGQFQSGPARFSNSYIHSSWGSQYDSWAGWAYSNMTNTTTPGYENQYSSIAGGGHSSANFGLAYEGIHPATVWLPPGVTVTEAFFTNTTYDYYALRDGYGVARKFGHQMIQDEWVNTHEPDWFKVTITGKNAAGQSTGSVDFYLADYRFANDADDYIVTDWRSVSLSGLGSNLRAIELTFSSTDNDEQFGINTPAYAAVDDLTLVGGTPQKVWLGGAGGKWSAGASWGGSAPAGGEPLLFDAAAPSTTDNDLQGMQFSEIAFGLHAGALALAGQPVTLTGAVLNYSGRTQTIGLGLALGPGGGAFNTAVSDVSVAGPISGEQTLLKTGPARLALSGHNTYLGGTVVAEGTLEIGGADSLPAGRALTIGGDATAALASGAASRSAAASADAVPEPGTAALLAVAGFAAIGCWWRRQG